MKKSNLSEKRRREWFYVPFRLSSGKEIELGIPADRYKDFTETSISERRSED